MSIEIELKFIANEKGKAALTRYFAASELQSAPRHLSNTYYETVQGYLRQHDLGLRIRGCDGQYEMTLKTGGKVLGGLHQRPEFNVLLDKPELELRRLPANVWPPECRIDELQQALQPLFTTDFVRTNWRIAHQDSQIEVALDQGEIRAGEQAEMVCELELELVHGDLTALLDYAWQLVTLEGLRMGDLSKAARGYLLAQRTETPVVKAFGVLSVPVKATVEQGLIAALEAVFSHWQYHTTLWLDGEAHAKTEIHQAVALFRQVLVVFGGIVPRKVTVELRQHLTQLDTLFSEPALDPQVLCYSSDYLSTQIALLSWLSTAGWRKQISDKSALKLAGSFKRFADIMLSRSAAGLKTAFSSKLTAEEYQAQLPRLQREQLSFALLSGAYPRAQQQAYLEGWQALEKAVHQGQVSEMEQCRQQALTQPAFWLHGGIKP